jgi:inner membrane transporter RhtA
VPRRSVPPHAALVVSAVFHYLGPAFAVLLFARMAPLGVAWLRIASAAVVLAAWRRPWRALGRSGGGADVRVVVAWGLVLAAMNACFYLALDRLPLATVASIEFLPVIALAALGARTPRNAGALALAVGGAWLVTGVHVGGEATGLALAAANALLFAAYIVLGHRAAGAAGVDALGLAMLVAAVPATLAGAPAAGTAVLAPGVVAAGIGVGVCSSVIPYVADQLAMARVPRATYALMVALLPATAAVTGAVVLGQVPSAGEAAGVALVVCGVGLHRARDAGQARRSVAATPSSSPTARGGASSSSTTAPPGQYGCGGAAPARSSGSYTQEPELTR